MNVSFSTMQLENNELLFFQYANREQWTSLFPICKSRTTNFSFSIMQIENNELLFFYDANENNELLISIMQIEKNKLFFSLLQPQLEG